MVAGSNVLEEVGHKRFVVVVGSIGVGADRFEGVVDTFVEGAGKWSSSIRTFDLLVILMLFIYNNNF